MGAGTAFRPAAGESGLTTPDPPAQPPQADQTELMVRDPLYRAIEERLGTNLDPELMERCVVEQLRGGAATPTHMWACTALRPAAGESGLTTPGPPAQPPQADQTELMVRDPLYRAIEERLGTNLDPELFERCAVELLRPVYPGLSPV